LPPSWQRKYPNFWPETLRGLLVHSAEWTPGMMDGTDLAEQPKASKIAFLRRYGYGVPQQTHLVNSYDSQPCIVIQDRLQPFSPSENGQSIVFHEMEFPGFSGDRSGGAYA
jgi:hypothetical protein